MPPQNEWQYRIAVVIEAADKPAACELIASATGNPDDAFSFVVPLSASSEPPETHYGCESLIRVATYDLLPQFTAAFPTSQIWFLMSPDPNEVSASSFMDAIAQAGLQKVIFPEEW